MTFHKRTAVSCDSSPDCREMAISDGADALAVARIRGWVRVRRKGVTVDLCPAHKSPPP